ncbi:MAG: helix-turn-helix domain-containing protein [Pseudonocardiaceae bacterium]
MHRISEPVAARPPDRHPTRVLQPQRPVFYTAAETSEIVRLDESTLYRHLRNGTFPGIKIGGRYVVPQVVLERLIADVLATGRCVDLAEWTEQWRAEQAVSTERLTALQHHATAVEATGVVPAGVRLP